MRASKALGTVFSLALLLLVHPVLGKEDSQSGVGIKASASNNLRAEELKATGLIIQQSGRELTEYQVGEWEGCSDTTGVCIDTSVYTCSTDTLTGYCPGGANIRCCQYGIQAGSCSSEGAGLCGLTGNCLSDTIKGKCPGPAGVTCCPTCFAGTTECSDSCCTADQTCTVIGTAWYCADP